MPKEGMLIGKPVKVSVSAELYTDGSWSYRIAGLSNRFEIIGFLESISSLIKDESKKEMLRFIEGMNAR